MKLELTCPTCQSVLRVDAAHAGKQLRCPTCQGLTTIPFPEAVPVSSKAVPSKYNLPMQDWEQPSSPQWMAQPVSAGQSSGETASLVFGILGIFMNFGCGCLFPVWLVLNIYGLYLGYRSRGSLRKAALITNTISIVIGLVMAAWFYLSWLL